MSFTRRRRTRARVRFNKLRRWCLLGGLPVGQYVDHPDAVARFYASCQLATR